MCVYDAHKCAQIVNITHRRFEQVLCNLGRVDCRENRKINHLFQQTELIHRNVFTNTDKQYKALAQL